MNKYSWICRLFSFLITWSRLEALVSGRFYRLETRALSCSTRRTYLLFVPKETQQRGTKAIFKAGGTSQAYSRKPLGKTECPGSSSDGISMCAVLPQPLPEGIQGKEVVNTA